MVRSGQRQHLVKRRESQPHEPCRGEFYSKLMRPDTKTSCCNLADCRPTEIRSVDDHYEVKKDGRWIRVPAEKIVKVVAPDGGAHICAPPSTSTVWTRMRSTASLCCSRRNRHPS